MNAEKETYIQKTFFQTGAPPFAASLPFLIVSMYCLLSKKSLPLAALLLVIGLVLIALGMVHMKKLKSIISLVCVVLLILSAAAFSISVKQWSKILPASSYEDQGVRLFKPYNVLPVQVQNSGAIGRDRRTNPSKTVYMVYYQATDGSGYQWSDETLTQSMGQEIVNAGQTVERRVLRIPEEGTYITVEPSQTAESYTASLRERYNLMCGFAVI